MFAEHHNQTAADIQKSVDTLKDFVRNPYAWPGGYAKSLYIGGEPMCLDCVKSDFRQAMHEIRNWNMAAEVSIHWEGPSEFCYDCSAEIPTVYGDPDSPEEA